MVSFQESTIRRLRSNTNFSSSIQMNIRNLIIHEAQPLLRGHLKCRKLWQALNISDYKKEGILNDHALHVLFEKQAKNLKDLLQVKNPEELLTLLDEKGNGFLTEDEQILMFSIIKERMQVCASELCKIYEYALEKDMLKAISILEKDIIEYQSILRKRTYEKELDMYRQVGVEKLQRFEKNWQERLAKIERLGYEKLEKIREIHLTELNSLDEYKQKDLAALRVKPKIAVKDLQIQEKLYAYNDRFAEAHQIRTKLNVFESLELSRVEGKISGQQEKRRIKMKQKQELKTNQQLLKNEELMNRMKIKYEQEKTRLEKEIKVHYNDITKNQKSAANIAFKKGKLRDELRRLKQNGRNLQLFIKEMKQSKTPKVVSEKIFKSQISLKSKPNVLRLSLSLAPSPIIMGYKDFKINTDVLTRFNIRSDAAETDRPVNVKPDWLSSSSFASKTGKLLQLSQSDKKFLPSVAELYNAKLEPIELSP